MLKRTPKEARTKFIFYKKYALCLQQSGARNGDAIRPS